MFLSLWQKLLPLHWGVWWCWEHLWRLHQYNQGVLWDSLCNGVIHGAWPEDDNRAQLLHCGAHSRPCWGGCVPGQGRRVLQTWWHGGGGNQAHWCQHLLLCRRTVGSYFIFIFNHFLHILCFRCNKSNQGNVAPSLRMSLEVTFALVMTWVIFK